ncbi:hypothetical protein Acsp02_43240 [Actinoplanes sp. NBRC 103695]|nr:hypothetical protein Acsp02_43240 [Actinoplanes sp. NBRC 103695]
MATGARIPASVNGSNGAKTVPPPAQSTARNNNDPAGVAASRRRTTLRNMPATRASRAS